MKNSVREHRTDQDFGPLFSGELLRDEATFSKSDFDGVTYEPTFDATRLRGEMAHVYHTMKDGQWRTLGEIRRQQYSEAGISARLRDLRKERFGSHTIERRRRGDASRGLFEYRLSRSKQSATVKDSNQK